VNASDLALAGLALLLGWLSIRARAYAYPAPPPIPELPWLPRLPSPGDNGVGWDFEPFVMNEQAAGGAGEGGLAGDIGFRLAPTLGENRLSADAVLTAIQRIDADVFGGWFSEAGRSPLDVLAIARVESNYTADAVSRAGAVGLMQVLPSTAQQFGPWSAQQMIDDPDLSLIAGMSYLQWSWQTLERRLGRPPTRTEWFAAYNVGVGNVLDRGFIPAAYVSRVRLARATLGFTA
jgi:hypothetical protein